MRLQQIGAAVAQLGMRHLQLDAGAANDRKILAPVELKCFAGRKGQQRTAARKCHARQSAAEVCTPPSRHGQGDVLLLREAGFAGLQHGPADGILADRASALRRSSTALVKNLPDIFTIYKRFRICVNNVFIPQKWLKA